MGWSAADSFSFTVSSPPVVLPPYTFTILISYQANEHQNSLRRRTRLLNNAGADPRRKPHGVLGCLVTGRGVCVRQAPLSPKEGEWSSMGPSSMPLTSFSESQSPTGSPTTSSTAWCPRPSTGPCRCEGGASAGL